MPIAIDKAERLMMLIVQPMANMNMNAMISENGIVSAITSDVRMLRRKKSVVRITNMPPYITVSPTAEMDFLMISLLSLINSIL